MLDGAEALRSPWARTEGLRELLDWAAGELASGRAACERSGRTATYLESVRALSYCHRARSGLAQGDTAHFAADEAAVIAAFAGVDPNSFPLLAWVSGAS